MVRQDKTPALGSPLERLYPRFVRLGRVSLGEETPVRVVELIRLLNREKQMVRLKEFYILEFS